MDIRNEDSGPVVQEQSLYEPLLSEELTRIVELGCGDGVRAREIATRLPACEVVAFEVDRIQHAKNLEADKPDNLSFKLGGAESINLDAGTVDCVMLFKSLHHVPIPAMPTAMQEIRRVTRPGAAIYISEPIFAGAFNDIIRLFHDEQAVREAAFEQVRVAVETGQFELTRQIFFQATSHFSNFNEFENRLIKATHTDHRLDQATFSAVRAKFEEHMAPGGANFLAPMRVDLLQKPATT